MILEFILVHSMVLLGNGMHTVPKKKGMLSFMSLVRFLWHDPFLCRG